MVAYNPDAPRHTAMVVLGMFARCRTTLLGAMGSTRQMRRITPAQRRALRLLRARAGLPEVRPPESRAEASRMIAELRGRRR
jgi:hypothetical protein